VRDGVLYVLGFGDEVFSFDAANGRPLWRYQRQLPEGTMVLSKKTMALWDDMLIVATSDLHMVALDARSGRLVWDVAIPDSEGTRSNGGPLVADGVVMIGLASQRDGGSIIAAFNAQDGTHLWSFNTVAQEGTPGGDTWNGLPNAQRHGGSVWTSGSFDPATGLALWGVAQSYDTGPLRDLVPGENNDGLYTNSTLAFRPRTGELVWYYQHMANDQYDLDWVFERVIGDLQVDGQTRHVVMTGGKEGLFDTLDAATGE
jgi:alcohol dehydrogenase (cytochrome c)